MKEEGSGVFEVSQVSDVQPILESLFPTPFLAFKMSLDSFPDTTFGPSIFCMSLATDISLLGKKKTFFLFGSGRS